MMKKPFVFCVSFIVAAIIITFVIVLFSRSKQSLNSKLDAGASQVGVSENVTYSAPEGNYTLTITAVYDALPDTDEENAPEASRVCVIIYEYTNNDIENGLVISNSHFKAYDKSGNELELFPQKNLFEPGAIGTNGTQTASVAFALNSADNYIELDYYNDISSKTPDSVFIKEW